VKLPLALARSGYGQDIQFGNYVPINSGTNVAPGNADGTSAAVASVSFSCVLDLHITFNSA
jgi:hypothetical protein